MEATGTAPAATYEPSALNVDQWLATAEKTSALYAILTAMHISGFYLWGGDDYSYDIAGGGTIWMS